MIEAVDARRLGVGLPWVEEPGRVDQKSRSELLQRNEQVKAASNLAGNAGLALVAAGAVRWFFDGVDEYAMFWLLLGAGLCGSA